MTDQAEQDATERVTLLVVEDDDAVRAVVTNALSAMGHEVIAVADGAAALVQLEDMPAIAMVVTDVVMPGGYNGLDVIEAMRALRPDVRFLMMSGYTRDAFETASEWSRSIPLLAKPFSMQTLQNEVARILAAPVQALPPASAHGIAAVEVNFNATD